MKMKKLLSAAIAVCLTMSCVSAIAPSQVLAASKSSRGIKISAKNFPDKVFRKKMKKYDRNKNGYLSKSERKRVKTISIYKKKVTSLKGIGYFTNLRTLECSYNRIKKLDLTKNKNLKRVYCTGNRLTSLKVYKCVNLRELFCDRNKLTSLSLSGCASLTSLNCDRNKIKTLNLSKSPNVVSAECNNNQLKSINISNNNKLVSLYCDSNKLRKLSLSKAPMLRALSCSDNKIIGLDVSANLYLEDLYCKDNAIMSLDLAKNKKLERLDCSANNISSLDVTALSKLFELKCADNMLKTLDITQNRDLKGLDCSYNQIAEIDLTACPNLGISTFEGGSANDFNLSHNCLKSLDLSRNVNAYVLDCSYNYLTVLDVSFCAALGGELGDEAVGYLKCKNNDIKTLSVGSKAPIARFSYDKGVLVVRK